MVKANNVYVGDFRGNPKAKAIQTLYRANRITLDGVKKAVADGVITKEQYTEITGRDYE